MTSTNTNSLRGYLMLLFAAAIPCYIAYDLHQSALLGASESQVQLQTSQRQAAEIDRFRRQPRFAATSVLSDQELSAFVGQARAAAGIAETAIDVIAPQPLTVIGRSPYSQRPVAIDLRSLNLRQVTTLVDALTDVERGVWVSQLRLSPVRQQGPADDSEFWNVELTLTQLVFCPTSR